MNRTNFKIIAKHDGIEEVLYISNDLDDICDAAEIYMKIQPSYNIFVGSSS